MLECSVRPSIRVKHDLPMPMVASYRSESDSDNDLLLLLNIPTSP